MEYFFIAASIFTLLNGAWRRGAGGVVVRRRPNPYPPLTTFTGFFIGFPCWQTNQPPLGTPLTSSVVAMYIGLSNLFKKKIEEAFWKTHETSSRYQELGHLPQVKRIENFLKCTIKGKLIGCFFCSAQKWTFWNVLIKRFRWRLQISLLVFFTYFEMCSFFCVCIFWIMQKWVLTWAKLKPLKNF